MHVRSVRVCAHTYEWRYVCSECVGFVASYLFQLGAIYSTVH